MSATIRARISRRSGMIGNAPNSRWWCIRRFRRKTLAELIAYAKANPGKVNFGSAGAGTVKPHHRRIFRPLGRHHAGAYSLQGHRPGADRSCSAATSRWRSRRSPASHANVAAGLLRALAVTSTTRSSADAGRADHRRVRPAGIRRIAVLRPGCAGRHAAPHHRQAQQGIAGSACFRRGEEAVGRRTAPRSLRARRKTTPAFIDKDEKKWSQLVKASGVEQE